MPPEYQGPERRNVTRDEIAEMVAHRVDAKLDSVERSLKAHLDLAVVRLEQNLQSHTRQALEDHTTEAFPPGSVALHRAYHERIIEMTNTNRRMMDDLRAWAIKGTIFVAASFVLVGFLEWLRRSLQGLAP